MIFLGRSASSGLTGFTFSSTIYENKFYKLTDCGTWRHLPQGNCNCRFDWAFVAATVVTKVWIVEELEAGALMAPNLDFLVDSQYSLIESESSDFH